jgi:hypothetical protein
MLGNVSPLFLASAPLLFVGEVRNSKLLPASAKLAGAAGLLGIAAWVVMEPRALHTRWLLVPLGLIAVPSAAALCAASECLGDVLARRLVRGALALQVVLLLFSARHVVYAARYAIGSDTKRDVYSAERGFDPHSGYDLASWLNSHATAGRAAIDRFGGYRYFLDPHILANSETADELQCLFEQRGRPDFSRWVWYVDRGFKWIVVPRCALDSALAQMGEIHKDIWTVAYAAADDVVLCVFRSSTDRANAGESSQAWTASSGHEGHADILLWPDQRRNLWASRDLEGDCCQATVRCCERGAACGRLRE